jgi:hypothetical protein
LVQHLASTVPGEKDVDMEEALASFIQLPEDLAAAYFEQARTALTDELPALLTRFTNLLQDGDPVTALRRHPGRIIESVGTFTFIQWCFHSSTRRIYD